MLDESDASIVTPASIIITLTSLLDASSPAAGIDGVDLACIGGSIGLNASDAVVVAQMVAAITTAGQAGP